MGARMPRLFMMLVISREMGLEGIGQDSMACTGAALKEVGLPEFP